MGRVILAAKVNGLNGPKKDGIIVVAADVTKPGGKPTGGIKAPAAGCNGSKACAEGGGGAIGSLAWAIGA